MKQYIKRNTRGFSHHFLLPVIVVVAVAGIGGYVMLQSSSAATKPCNQRILKKGISSVCVRYAAQMMNATSGTGKDITKVDTVFGGQTHAKTIRYQAKKGLTQDGKIGPATWGKLCKDSYSGDAAAAKKKACGKQDSGNGSSSSTTRYVYKQKAFPAKPKLTKSSAKTAMPAAEHNKSWMPYSKDTKIYEANMKYLTMKIKDFPSQPEGMSKSRSKNAQDKLLAVCTANGGQRGVMPINNGKINGKTVQAMGSNGANLVFGEPGNYMYCKYKKL